MKLIFCALLLTFLGCGKSSTENSSTRTFREPVLARSYFDLMNDHRRSIGLSPLKYSATIEESARGHSRTMATIPGSFGHFGWRGRCRLLRAKLGSTACGEIIAKGQKTNEAVLEAWLNSPAHREAIENPDWTHSGIGLVVNTQGRHYWTQIFLRIPP